MWLLVNYLQSEKIEVAETVVNDGASTAVPEAVVEKKAKIVFAADFANNQGCDGHSNAGCDVYTASIDWSGEVSDVKQQTNNSSQENFPVFAVDGKTVYANADTDNKHGNIEWVTLADQKSGILVSQARGAAPLADGKQIVYVKLDGTLALMVADLATAWSIGTAQQISPTGQRYSEPHVSANGDLVFYQLAGGTDRGSNTAQGGAYLAKDKKFIELTAANGYAHCFWGFDGQTAYCNNLEQYPGISKIVINNGIAEAPVGAIHHPTVAEMTAVDSDYAQCATTQFAYGSFCDATHLLVTVGCGTKTTEGSDTTMSKLALLDLTTGTPKIVALGKNLAAAFGATGTSSYTGSCRLID